MKNKRRNHTAQFKAKVVFEAAKVVRHVRYVIFQMAEAAVPRHLFQEIPGRIRQLTLMVMPYGRGMMPKIPEKAIRGVAF